MSRAQERKYLASLGLQNTQRSWDNYAGKNPIKSWAAQGFYNSADDEDKDEEERDDKGKGGSSKSGKITFTPKKKVKSSKLKDSLDSIRGFSLNKDSDSSSKKPSWSAKSTAGPVRDAADKDDGSMLPPGYRLDEDGRVLNTAGYVQDEKWYTIDPKTGKKRMKTPSEAGMIDGGRLYT